MGESLKVAGKCGRVRAALFLWRRRNVKQFSAIFYQASTNAVPVKLPFARRVVPIFRVTRLSPPPCNCCWYTARTLWWMGTRERVNSLIHKWNTVPTACCVQRVLCLLLASFSNQASTLVRRDSGRRECCAHVLARNRLGKRNGEIPEQSCYPVTWKMWGVEISWKSSPCLMETLKQSQGVGE